LSHTSQYLVASAAPAPPVPDLANDFLGSVRDIAQFLYGKHTKKELREIYRLSSEVPPEDRLPIFRMGKGKLVARKSTILAWITAREAARQSTTTVQLFMERTNSPVTAK
jgi:hypothetical protein